MRKQQVASIEANATVRHTLCHVFADSSNDYKIIVFQLQLNLIKKKKNALHKPYKKSTGCVSIILSG